MLRIFTDSGSSIKKNECEALGVEILPLRIVLGEEEYSDGVDLTAEVFYDALIKKKQFPKTSLPSLSDAEERVNAYTDAGDDVIILTISSGISGTFGALHTLFLSNSKVRVIDTKTAVGGVRILVMEALKYKNESLDFIEARLLELIPRIRVIAIPATLEYLHRGGRLSKTAFTVGSVLHLKPLISLDSSDGKVKAPAKAIGLYRAMNMLVKQLEAADTSYPIVPSYTYDKSNLDRLVSMADEKFRAVMTEYDDLDFAIACHWGPSAFGFIFVVKE